MPASDAARGVSTNRLSWARAGIQTELLSITWMIVEAAVAIGAGIAAHSLLLTAFGLDSVLELIVGAALLWRLTAEASGQTNEAIERAERTAAWIAGVGLALLCLYILIIGGVSLFAHHAAESAPVGIGLAVASLALMPLLAWRKKAIARQLDSAALMGDAACSITCAYMAGTLLIGLALNLVFGWWWADSLAALALLWWLVPEARETLQSAAIGHSGCSCGDLTRG